MTNPSEEDLRNALASLLLKDGNDDEGVVDGIDGDIVSYLAGMLHESDLEDVEDSIGPFLEGYGCDDDLVKACGDAVMQCAKNNGGDNDPISHAVIGSNNDTQNGAVKLKQGLVSMSSALTDQSEAEMDANRHGWGLDNKIAAMTNEARDAHDSTVSVKDKRKARKELEASRKEYEAKMATLEAEEEGDAGKASVSNMVIPDYRSGRNEKDIHVRNVCVSLDNGTQLLSDGELKLAHQRRYGLVGKNGVGKTTLLKAVASLEIEGMPRHHRILHVRQEIRAAGGDISVIKAVMDADVERNTLIEEEKKLLQRLEGEGVKSEGVSVKAKLDTLKAQTKDTASDGDTSFNDDLKRLDEVYERLQILGSDTAESRASTILFGLQFTPSMQKGPTSALSGGWRMRVALAAALFIEPDLLMLDEPTNHLDLEAVLWLESYLQSYRHTLIVVSHDRSFLNEVCTDTIEFKNKKLNYYKGDYDTYVRTSEENVRNCMRVYQAYMDKREHMMEFINKFRASASRAKLVQSRVKAVERMDLEAPDPVVAETLWRFSIPNPEPLGRPIISIDDVWFDYATVDGASGTKKPKDEWILQQVNFGVDLDSRVGILGPNGAGKSTLLNLIMDRLEPNKGSLSRNGNLRIGHFTQHSADKFDLQLSAVENMLKLFPGTDDQVMRSFLGKFQIQGTDALKPMMMLSGGQKSRVAFASLSYQKPHVIIMDEPTNHLDMESIDALVEAVKDFHGGLIVVSHDQHFITNTCGELWVVGDGKVTRYRGEFNDYKNETLKRTAKRVADSVKSLSTMNNN
eukprot:CAMPEP_0172306260 /NCGR_PEP_ID=MMETSP1058-20130122/7364_1 /TAXON_ID=83371 /ORGANISM="Detonula confervacea, Strain CCMP 353" /LENGTH=797 /DNA_ID=CAMNT_0013018085 /DNA_START=111 /DNA_END=2504 /DNA_ORIENTATION=-